MHCYADASKNFGAKVKNMKSLKKMLNFLENKKIVHEESKMMVVEMYWWIEDCLKLNILNPMYITELKSNSTIL